MKALQKRFVLFLVGCMGTRFLLVHLARTVPLPWLRAMAIPAAAIATGFALIALMGWRKVGLETGGAPIWWNALRPFHAAMYGLFAYFAWTGNRDVAWKLLLADVLVGLTSFLVYHGWLRPG